MVPKCCWPDWRALLCWGACATDTQRCSGSVVLLLLHPGRVAVQVLVVAACCLVAFVASESGHCVLLLHGIAVPSALVDTADQCVVGCTQALPATSAWRLTAVQVAVSCLTGPPPGILTWTLLLAVRVRRCRSWHLVLDNPFTDHPTGLEDVLLLSGKRLVCEAFLSGVCFIWVWGLGCCCVYNTSARLNCGTALLWWHYATVCAVPN
jgi:hypothetical protein